MHDAGPHAPGLTGLDRFGRLAALQHIEFAVQQIGGIETGMRMQAGIHVRLHLNQHHHCFEMAVGNVESFQDRSRDRFRHDKASIGCRCAAGR
jgi:hypothetical protein